jgi:hypothetical protein
MYNNYFFTFSVLAWKTSKITKSLIYLIIGLLKSKNILNVSWNRSQVLKDLRFYQIIPGLLASPFIVTGVFFHQIHLIETKSWSIITIGHSRYPFFALSVTGVTLGSGWIVDRFSTVHLLRFFLWHLLLVGCY